MATNNVRFVAKNGLDNNGNSITNVGTSGSSLTLSGANALTIATSGTTSLTLPTSGTLATTSSNVSSSTSLAGGATGNVPYQSGAGATAFVTNAAGILQAATSGATPTWTTTPTLTGTNFSSIPNSALTNSSVTVNGTAISLGSSGTVTAAAGTLTGGTLASGVTASSLTSVGTLSALAVTGTTTHTGATNLAGASSPLQVGGSAGTSGQVLTSAGAGATPTWSAAGTAAAGSLTGTTLASNVTSSSLATFTAAATFSAATPAVTLSGTAPQMSFTNATSNTILMGTSGIAAPTFTTRSAGTKLVLYSSLSGSNTDFALGINSSTLWYSVGDTGSSHRWYAATTNIATLSGIGKLSLTGDGSTAASDLVVTNNINGITRVSVNNSNASGAGQADFGAVGSATAGGAFFGIFTAGGATDATVTSTALTSNDFYAFGSGTTQRFGIFTNNTRRLTVTAAGSVILGTGALTTTATDGFLYITTAAGVPTGVPTAATGRAALQIDSTNNDIYFYNGAWVRPVRSFSAGTTGFTPSSATTGAVTLAGTLNVANGGTGVTSSTGTVSVVLNTAPTFATSIDGGATFGAFASSTALTLGYTGTAASTTNISTGAVAASTTKTINIGTGGAASSTTNVNIGSTNGGTVTSNSNFTVSGTATATAFNATSTKRVKKAIKKLNIKYLDSFSSLKPVEYKRKGSDKQEIGFIAEDMAKIYPEIVGLDDKGRPGSIDYSRLSTILTAKVQEQQSAIDRLEKTVAKLVEMLGESK
jgi:hypothetical protein